ncbi:MAG: hypothetical protein ROR55_07490 [Devosia sp.]
MWALPLKRSIILALGMLPGSTAWADCAPFEVHGKGQPYEGTLIDHAQDGRSAGDIHIGSRGIADEDGEPVGRVSWVNTSLDADSAHTHLVMELPDGEIHYSGRIVGLGGARNEETSQYERIFSVIHGGTGEYVHASGTVEAIMEPEGPRYIVTVRCD